MEFSTDVYVTQRMTFNDFDDPLKLKFLFSQIPQHLLNGRASDINFLLRMNCNNFSFCDIKSNVEFIQYYIFVTK